MKRGEIWWVNLDPTQGSEICKTRPAVVLTVDGLNRARRTVVVVLLSSSASAKPPIVVPLPSVGVDSVAVCDQLRAVDKTRLIGKVGSLSKTDIQAVGHGVKLILGLS